MFIFPALVGCLVLTTLGYFALWTSSHENTSKGLVGFGKVLSTILFVFAGLVFLTGAVISFSPWTHDVMRSMWMKHHMMMEQGCQMEGMHHNMGMMENKEKMPARENEAKNENMQDTMKK
jgi:hypothetical protein